MAQNCRLSNRAAVFLRIFWPGSDPDYTFSDKEPLLAARKARNNNDLRVVPGTGY
jgi:hypothetical protein